LLGLGAETGRKGRGAGSGARLVTVLGSSCCIAVWDGQSSHSAK
jgi:hypothetical protein